MAKNTHLMRIDQRAAYISAVAPNALEVLADRLHFPGAAMLPMTIRGAGAPGMPQRPWNRARANDFQPGTPAVYSLALRREMPDTLRSSLRIRRTIFEGFLLALSEKTGRRPSKAEQVTDAALDEAESRLALGDAAFRITLLAGIYAARKREQEADTARRILESRMRSKGFNTQHLTYIAERALIHFQPAGNLFPGIHEPTLMLDETLQLLPLPERQILPPRDSVYLGNACRDGRDIYFSLFSGLDPDAVQPPHATTLLLGEMGSGKTSLLRFILLQRLLQGRRIISLDPEGENNALCEALGGRVIPAGQPPNKDRCLLHPLEADSAGELLFAVRFLISTLSGGRELPATTQAVLHDIIQDFWRNNPGKTLSLSGLHKALCLEKSETEEVRALLKPYSRGGLWDGFFDRKTALLDRSMMENEKLQEDLPWWNFDLSGLRAENKQIVHALLTWFLYRVVSVTSVSLDIYLDEGWRLLRSTTFAALLDELGRRARKRGIGIFLATHLPRDLDAEQSAMGLASMTFTGRLGPQQAENLLTALGISPEAANLHAEKIGKLPPRNFYAIPSGGRSSLFDFQVRLPPGWLAWWKKHGAAR